MGVYMLSIVFEICGREKMMYACITYRYNMSVWIFLVNNLNNIETLDCLFNMVRNGRHFQLTASNSKLLHYKLNIWN